MTQEKILKNSNNSSFLLACRSTFLRYRYPITLLALLSNLENQSKHYKIAKLHNVVLLELPIRHTSAGSAESTQGTSPIITLCKIAQPHLKFVAELVEVQFHSVALLAPAVGNIYFRLHPSTISLSSIIF